VLFRGGADPALAKGSTIEPGRIAHARRPEAIPADDTCSTPDDGNVCWQGGPVLHTIDPYLILWEPSSVTPIPTASVDLLEMYLTDVAADTAETGDTYGVARQYFDSTGFADQRQTFDAAKQAIVDADAYPDDCPSQTGFPSCVTDDDIQSELSSLIAADDLPTGTGPNAPVYFVVTPEDTDVCFDTVASDGCSDLAVHPTDNDFCAYHSNFEDFDAGDSQVIYAPIPFSSEQYGLEGCQGDESSPTPQYPNGDFADTIADLMSHESNESITDPIVTPAATGWEDFVPPNGNSQNEIADNCINYAATADPSAGNNPNAYSPTIHGDATPANPPTIFWGTLADQLINGDYYFTQSVWSDGQQNCETAPNGGTLSAAFTTPPSAPPNTTVTFNPSSTVAAAGVSSATWSFGDGATAFSAGPLADMTHAYKVAGRYDVSLTVVDEDGQLSSVSHTVVIGTAPKASFTESPSAVATGATVAFSAAGSSDTNAGGSIAAYAWSFGDGATGTGLAPKHAYSRPGVYTVRLSVADVLGFTASESSQVTVAPLGKITKLALRRSGRSELLVVTVSGPGTVRVGKTSKTLTAAGSTSFKVGSAPKKRHKLKLKAAVVYTPRFGPVVRRIYSGVVFGR
jgi:PKD repeat protein